MMLRPTPGAVANMSDAMFEAASDCFMCQKKFQVFRRKHRCRVRSIRALVRHLHTHN